MLSASHTIQTAFSDAASRYDQAALVQRDVGEYLCERLTAQPLDPEYILDLGAGTGHISKMLKKLYKNSTIIPIDFAHGMLKENNTFPSTCASATALPFQTQSVDIVISNLMLQWCDNIENVFKEVLRVLKPGGLFLFSTFGPDTLKELHDAWAQVDDQPHVHAFIDMHHIGDALLHQGFKNPVMDMEMIRLAYDNVNALVRDLKDLGATNKAQARRKTLTGKKRFQAFKQAYNMFKQSDGTLPATYEVIYGHAIAPEYLPQMQNEAGDILISLDTLMINDN